jgi:membrane protease subunit HflC
MIPESASDRRGAGLAVRVPFAEQVVWIDKRIQSVEMERQQVLSTDQLRLQVDAYARYRITNPLRMYVSAGSEERVQEALRPILGSALRNELGKRPFAALLSPERGWVMHNIETGLNRVARQYGAEVIDVRIKRADLPDGTPLQSAFQRMRTAAPAGGADHPRAGRAAGADHPRRCRCRRRRRSMPRASARIPTFYDFYRAMQAYRRTFNPQNEGQTTVILSPENDFLREFRGR